MRLNPDTILKDPAYPQDGQPDARLFEEKVDGSTVYGEIYLPGSIYESPHPLVLLFHGIPGTTVNDDIAQDLRRIGFEVIRIFHRGAWGSEGIYSFSHCIDDAMATAIYVRNHAMDLNIDPDNIFLAGHSNGGNTVLNVLPQLPWVRGAVVMAPFNHASLWKYDIPAGQTHEEAVAQFCTELGHVLHKASDTALFEDSKAHMADWDFANKAEVLKDRNLLIQVGLYDDDAPEKTNVADLWKKLESLPTTASHRLIRYPGKHGFDSCRLQLAEDMGRWMASLIR